MASPIDSSSEISEVAALISGSALAMALKDKTHPLHDLFEFDRDRPMTAAALTVALQPVAVINKMWADLVTANALCPNFLTQEAQPISLKSCGWSSPWSDSEAPVALQKSGKYQAAISARHIKRTCSRNAEWSKIQEADDQFFSHTLLERGFLTSVDFRIPFQASVANSSLLPAHLKDVGEIFELDNNHEGFFGAIYSAWKAWCSGQKMDPWIRCFQTMVLCLNIAEHTKDMRSCRALQHGQHHAAEFHICKDTALDFARHYHQIVLGIQERGQQPTVKAILSVTDKHVKWSKGSGDAKFTQRTMSAIKGIHEKFLEDPKVRRALLKFNITYGTDTLCNGFWHLDGFRMGCVNTEWLPFILDATELYMRRGICSKKKLTIDNIRGKPINKTNSDAVLGWSSLFAMHKLLLQKMLEKVELHNETEVSSTFMQADKFELAFPTSSYIMSMQKAGISVTSTFPKEMQQMQQHQQLACKFCERLRNGDFDSEFRALWKYVKGELPCNGDKVEFIIEHEQCSELAAAWHEVMQALDHLSSNVVNGLTYDSLGLQSSSKVEDDAERGQGDTTLGDRSSDGKPDGDGRQEIFAKATQGRLKWLDSTVHKFKSEKDVTDYINHLLIEYKPEKHRRHVLIPIDIQDGPESDKCPWAKQARLSDEIKMVINGAVKACRPGVFIFVSAGRLPKNKYESYCALDGKKGFNDEELSSPVEITFIGQAHHTSKMFGGRSGSFQARNCETIHGITAKSSGWRSLKKKNCIFDSQKSSYSNDFKLTKILPRDQLQISKELKQDIWEDSAKTVFDFTNLEMEPSDADGRAKWARRHLMSKKVKGCNPLVWDGLESPDWMELFSVCMAPVTYCIDLQAGAGKKAAAACSMPIKTQSVCRNSAHLQHVLKVVDIQIVREMCRASCFWWQKDSCEQVQNAFPDLFRDGDDESLMSTDSDDDNGKGQNDVCKGKKRSMKGGNDDNIIKKESKKSKVAEKEQA